MGTYTRLGVACVVREAYRDRLASQLEAARRPPYPRWGHLLRELEADGEGDSELARAVRQWHEETRSMFIPFASLSSQTTELNWGDHNEFDPETGRWVFTCALKNYGGEILRFCGGVLFVLAERVDRLQTEIDPLSYTRVIRSWSLQGGELIEIDSKSGDYESLEPASEFV